MATWRAWCAATNAAGWDLACGTQLEELLRAAGFPAVEAHPVQDPFCIVAGRRTAS